MKAQPLKSFFCNTFLMALLVAPVLIIAEALIGLGLFAYTDYQQTARWICGIGFGTSIVFMPIALKVFTKPPAHTPIVTFSTYDVATVATQMDDGTVSTERRKHARYQHNCAALFHNEHLRGFAAICDVSQKGCRLRSKLSVRLGDTAQIVVDMPGFQNALAISHGIVRWVRGSESGIEFIAIQDERRFLRWVTEIAQSVVEIRPPKDIPALSSPPVAMRSNF